ncbi:MAG: DUF1761 domain-containing protein [Patescibacteria group bacterium]
MDVVINYWAVLAAAAVNMVIGFLWYGPVLGAKWKAYMGFTDESMKNMPLTPIQAIVGGVIASILIAVVMAHSLVFASYYLSVEGVSAGLQVGFWNWLGFVLPVTAGTFLWEGRPLGLWILNAGYYLLSFLLMGLILATWI